jgi:cytochrome c-type biogenesis protein CcmF
MEALTGEKETIDAPYYNRVNVPIALFLLLLTGVGPLIAWRKSSIASLRRAFAVPVIAGSATIVVLAALGVHQIAPLVSFGLCAFVAASIIGEFWKGSRAIQAKEHISLPRSAFELTWRNTRRYGGYLVHMGIVFMFIGFTGSAFNIHQTLNLGLQQSVRVGRYEAKLLAVNEGDTSDYKYSHATLSLSIDGRDVGQLEPEIRVYNNNQQQSSIVGIRRRLNEDFYVNYSGVTQDNSKAVFQFYVFPLVSWIWMGYWVLLFGTLICLIPAKVRLQYARTEVVGIATTPATVQP